MKPEIETKVTYGTWGLIGGAAIATIVGFGWGGWTTSGTTQKMSDQAVLASRAEICVAQFMKGPDRIARIKQFMATESYQRSAYIENGGWDRMPGQDKSAWGVAGACVAQLEVLIKT